MLCVLLAYHLESFNWQVRRFFMIILTLAVSWKFPPFLAYWNAVSSKVNVAEDVRKTVNVYEKQELTLDN